MQRPQESGMACHLTLVPMRAAIIRRLLPKEWRPTGRLPLLPPSMSVSRECPRLDDGFKERLCLLRRLDNRDDGMPYTHDAKTFS